MTNFNIKAHVSNNLKQAAKRATTGAEKYKQTLLTTLQTNLTKTDKRGQDFINDNAGLISRIKAVQPHGLNQMQQAFEAALA